MNSCNFIGFVGNFGKDYLELNSLKGGVSKVDFSLSLRGFKKGKDKEYEEHYSFINCTAFGETAKIIVENVAVKDKLGVVARVQQDRWEDESGKKYNKLYFIVEKITFVGSREVKEEDGKPSEGKKKDPVKSSVKNEPQYEEYSNIEDDEDEIGIPF
jgi:single-strand DNA-binding protein